MCVGATSDAFVVVTGTDLMIVPHNTKGSAYRVEAAESGDLAVWAFYAVIIKIVSCLKPGV
jgi:hypothetical protein